jgi:hypothetical protein
MVSTPLNGLNMSRMTRHALGSRDIRLDEMRCRAVSRADRAVIAAVVSCIVGSMTGFVVAMFRIALMRADI